MIIPPTRRQCLSFLHCSSYTDHHALSSFQASNTDPETCKGPRQIMSGTSGPSVTPAQPLTMFQHGDSVGADSTRMKGWQWSNSIMVSANPKLIEWIAEATENSLDDHPIPGLVLWDVLMVLPQTIFWSGPHIHHCHNHSRDRSCNMQDYFHW